MEKADFDPSETIAGFPLLSIKRALTLVGILDDRDDVKNVADALSCPRSQAERVLAALERRGLVTPTTKKNQWKTTPLGWQLNIHWKPPPRLEPAIALDNDKGSKAINEVFDEVPCSILRADADDGNAFEEARLEVGVFVEYASARVIEVSVTIPDDYDHPDSSSTFESSVYVGVEDAKRFAKALQKAIERAEAELARRSKRKPRSTRAPSATEKASAGGNVTFKRNLPTGRTPEVIASEAAKLDAAETAAKQRKERAVERKRKQEERELAATLRELGGPKEKRSKA